MPRKLVRIATLVVAACLIAYGVFVLVLVATAGPDQVIGSKPLDEVVAFPHADAFVRLELDPVDHPLSDLDELEAAATFEQRLARELSHYFGDQEQADTRNRVGFVLRSAKQRGDSVYLFGTMSYRTDDPRLSGSGFTTVRVVLDQNGPPGGQIRAVEVDGVGEPNATAIQGPEYAPWMDAGGEDNEVAFRRLTAK